MHHDPALEKSALFIATLTSFIGPFMISAVNVALPAIQAEWAVDAVGLSWISTAYLLSTAVVLLPAGKLADIHGRKKIFTTGLWLYTAASTLAAFVPSIAWLIGMRVIQGFGAAMFITTGMAILTSVFPPERRGRVIGIYVAAVYIGLSVGPFAGGILTQWIGWRSIFALMLPLGAASIFAALRYLKGEWADDRQTRFDLAGSLLYAASIFLLVYGATFLPKPRAIILTGIGVIGAIAFFRLEIRTVHPVFDVSLFQKNRIFAFSSIAALINYSATFAVTFLISLYLQYLKGMSPQTAGAVLMAQPLVMAVFSPLAGRYADRMEPRRIASTGMGITAIGLFNFVLLKPETRLPLIIGNLVLMGFGFALFSSPNMSAIMGSVDRRLYGIASGATATMRLLGQMVSMAIATVVLALSMGHRQIDPASYPLFLHSVRICFGIFAALCAIGVGFSLSRGRIQQIPV
ncbi:MAG: MFS transporter [Deltaproteobacteria bacterium]|nr:MFS transporter [Deltaproteobacteria bacterium]